jgi:FtsZ-binding cell division protein ZapB
MVDILPEEKHGFHVDFELRAEEDREASIKSGHPVFRDVEIAILTMPGGNLVLDKLVNDELLREWKVGVPGRKPPSPFAMSAYEAWKDGREAPVNGIDLKNWPGVTPAQLKMCQGISVRTVENLAEANADTIRKLGMGGVALKDKAAAYLLSAGKNKASEEVSALKVEMQSLKEAIDKKDDRINDLLAQFTDGPPKKTRKKAA